MKALKRTGDKALPTEKSEMLVLYYQWKYRTKPLSLFEYGNNLFVKTATTTADDDNGNIINHVESVWQMENRK